MVEIDIFDAESECDDDTPQVVSINEVQHGEVFVSHNGARNVWISND